MRRLQGHPWLRPPLLLLVCPLEQALSPRRHRMLAWESWVESRSLWKILWEWEIQKLKICRWASGRRKDGAQQEVLCGAAVGIGCATRGTEECGTIKLLLISAKSWSMQERMDPDLRHCNHCNGGAPPWVSTSILKWLCQNGIFFTEEFHGLAGKVGCWGDLQNPGNTCFINYVLQCLMYSTFLATTCCHTSTDSPMSPSCSTFYISWAAWKDGKPTVTLGTAPNFLLESLQSRLTVAQQTGWCAVMCHILTPREFLASCGSWSASESPTWNFSHLSFKCGIVWYLGFFLPCKFL